jgi:hypothetical protein
VAKGQKGDAGAVFDLAPNPGLVSDKRAANGGVMACVKKAKKHNLTGKKGAVFAAGKRDMPPGGLFDQLLARSGTAGAIHAGIGGGHES